MRAHLQAIPTSVVAPVNRRIFGSFIEHMGRCVYSGIYEPGHPRADARGFRRDVLALVKEQGVSLVRYPGGNFVSGYRWEDGTGPVAERPTRLDPAWRTIETNEFGLGEFMAWAVEAGVEPMMAVNLGTRGLPEALDLLEYTSFPSGTHLSDLRRAHGAEAPYDIRLWCLGNEMDGDWQLGHMDADEYGRLAARVARGMRQIDGDLELVVCGSSSRGMSTFGSWEATVLRHAYEVVDMISAHAYYELEAGDVASFLASSASMSAVIEDVIATADHVGAALKSPRKINISFDEWNVWYMRALHETWHPTAWARAPRLSEDDYTALDAVVVGSLLITLLRHSDRVAAACQAQLVNTIGAIRSEPGGPAWRQTTFHPFALTARYARGAVLRTEVTVPSITTAKYGEVAAVDAVTTYDVEAGELVVFAVNRSPERPISLDADLGAFGAARLVEALRISEENLFVVNTAEEPDRVVPRPAEATVTDGLLQVTLPPASWTVVRLEVG